jgi:outer membrane immunogenic protein
MKKLLLGSVALVALGVGAPAIAADMGVRPMMAAPSTWNGCYVGGFVGDEWGKSKSRLAGPRIGEDPALLPVPIGTEVARYNLNGFTGGFDGGCDAQFGYWVLGIVGDMAAMNKDGQDFLNTPTSGTFNEVAETRERWMATARVRLGYAVDKELLYVTGGAAWGAIQYNETRLLPTANPTPPPAVEAGNPLVRKAEEKHTVLGYAVGAGWDHAIGYGWSTRTEYLYTNFGWTRFYDNHTTGDFGRPHDVYLDNHRITFGLNYKFDFGKAPMVVSK